LQMAVAQLSYLHAVSVDDRTSSEYATNLKLLTTILQDAISSLD
jgi:hypothetical protein